MNDKPWETEPDALLVEHHGFVCHIKRHPHLGNLNGYVYIPKGHPCYGLHYEDIDEVYVHGGLTHAGWDNDMWVLGFDTAHADDYIPTARIKHTNPVRNYRDIAYVNKELESLARQLKKRARMTDEDANEKALLETPTGVFVLYDAELAEFGALPVGWKFVTKGRADAMQALADMRNETLNRERRLWE